MITLVTILFLIVTVLMIIAILMQSSKSDGIGAGFGALGGTQVFGGRGPADFLKKFTAYVAMIYGVLVILLTVLNKETSNLNENPLLNQSGTEQINTAPVTDEFQDTENTITDSIK